MTNSSFSLCLSSPCQLNCHMNSLILPFTISLLILLLLLPWPLSHDHLETVVMGILGQQCIHNGQGLLQVDRLVAKEKWHARASLPMSSSSRSASNTTPTSKWHRDANMEFHALYSWCSKLSADENVEEVADPTSSEMLSGTITERHTSPKSGDKLSFDAELVVDNLLD